MKAAFLRLYLLLVVTVVGAGWSLESLWQHLAQTEGDGVVVHEFVALVESRLSQHEQATWPDQVATLNQQLNSRHELLALADVTGSEHILSRLQRGEVVPLRDGADRLLLAKRLANSPHVFAYRASTETQTGAQLENLLLVAFYLAIAAALFLWAWPLHRDLRRLETAARDFGKGNWQTRAAVRPRSALFSLARSFNHMAKRIGELINAHKELTNSVSHEFRTPLARMRFALEAVNEAGDTSDRKRLLDGIGRDVDELERLVNELLEYATIEREGVQLNREPVRLCERLSHEATRVPKPDAVQIVVECNMRDAYVNCDWRYMQRLLQNLLVNAVRHAMQQVYVRLEQDDTDFLLRVEDDGRGIPHNERQRIFEPFARVADEGDSKHEGFGLGLAIVRRVAEWHGGNVEVTDSSLGGAGFVVRWPKRG